MQTLVSNSRRKGLSPKALRNIPRAPFISRSMIKPDSSLMVLDPPNFSSTLPSQLRVRLVYASLTSKTRDPRCQAFHWRRFLNR